MLFEDFHESCLVHAHRLYLSGMKEAFLCPFLAWPIQSSFYSWRHTVWRKMLLFEEYQDCYLVLGRPDIWIKWVYLFWASMLPGFCSRDHMVFKKKLFKEFQDDCFMHGHLWYMNGLIWAIQCHLFVLVYAYINIWIGKRYCLENWRQLPLWHNTMIMPAVSPQSPVWCPTNLATVLYKYADVFLSF